MGRLKETLKKLRAPRARDKARNDRRNQGIRRRWMTNSLGVALVIVMTALAAYVVVISNTCYSAVRSALEPRAASAASFISAATTTPEAYYSYAAGLVADFSDRSKMELQFIDANGRIEMTTGWYGGGLVNRTPDVLNAISTAQVQTWTGDNPLTGERVMSASAPITLSDNRVIGVIRYVTSLASVDRQIWQMTGLALLVCFVFLIVLSVTNLIFIRGIVTPIQEINEAAKRIADGRYGTRIEKHYDDEIGELADNINHMSSEISAAERMKTDFISSVSHELRSPLTAINGWGETLLSADINDPREIKKGVSIMLKETVRLIKLVEELLDFTRMEGGQMRVQLEELNIAVELEEVVYMYMDAMRREGIRLDYKVSGDIPPVKGDRARLKQVFLNLLDNASKHGGEGKRIDVSIWRAVDDVAICIRDYGPGIPPEELPHVKYKFYKGSSKARGSGIGLAISDEIIRLHDGELNVSSEEGKGTEVLVTIPVYEKSEG